MEEELGLVEVYGLLWVVQSVFRLEVQKAECGVHRSARLLLHLGRRRVADLACRAASVQEAS